MPDTQPPLPIARAHNNQQLFSDYYLNALLPKHPEWRLLRNTGMAMWDLARRMPGDDNRYVHGLLKCTLASGKSM